MRRPETRFVSVGRDRVAFLVFGEGTVDALNLRGWLGSIDSVWEHPGHLRIWRSVNAFLRTCILDHRGLGVSDSLPPSRLGDLDDRVADVEAVLDAISAERVVVLGEFDGAATAIKFAVEHPDRVDKLVLMNGYAKGTAGDGYVHGPRAEQVDRTAEWVRMAWGTGEVLAFAAPALAGDREFAARFERVAARPGAAAALMRNLAAIDVRSYLDRVTVPTLVLYSGDITTVSIAQSMHLAEHIPGARFVEGTSGSFYWGEGLGDELASFLGFDDPTLAERELLTVLFTDAVDSTQTIVASGDVTWRRTLDYLDDLVQERVQRFNGHVIKQTGDGHLIEFTRPGDAVSAGIALCRDAPTLGLALRAGVHMGEVERRNEDLGGLTVNIAARIAALAGAGEVLVSRTVAELLGGTDFTLSDRGEHALKGIPVAWTVFAVTDHAP
jgi:class 3 adenylate cyclase/pimeloyl-ACP methyl ester carboxylesterase